MALPEEPAERHRVLADGFARVADQVPDWDAPTPVREWRARDVVDHLVTWLPALLESGSSVRLGPGPSAQDDPLAAWHHHARQVQQVLDEPDSAGAPFSNPHTGDWPVEQAIDRFYTSDVFLHTWDLGAAAGVPVQLDEQFAEQMLDGLRSMDEILRSSGQFGPAVPVPSSAPVQDRLIGFIGRDPSWRNDA